MQDLSSSTAELNNFIDYSSFDESINLDEFISNISENHFTLTKLFALLRTWNKTVHNNFAKLIFLILEKDINIDEYDAVTGMNLLHFTCKFGAKQIGHEKEATQILNVLIEKGINLNAHCLWMQMNCLHYCAFFDSALVCELLLKHSSIITVVNQPCCSFKNNTPLHLACSTLSLSTVHMLLKAGANKQIRDDHHRIPIECIPVINSAEQRQIVESIRALLRDQEPKQPQQKSHLIDSSINKSNNQPTMQFQIGERVRLVSNNKTGTVKYFGSVPFGVNLWYGIELDDPCGKHDGCVGGIRYFTCPANKGTFVQPSFLRKLTPVPFSPDRDRRFRPINFPLPDMSSVPSRVDTGLKRDSSADSRLAEQFQVKDRVSLSKNRHGTVRYIGPTQLGSGTWYGIELDSANGLHDGSLTNVGQRYFQCKPQHGVFVRGHNLKKLRIKSRRTHSLSSSVDAETRYNPRLTTSDYDATMLTGSHVEDDAFTKSIESSILSISFQIGDKVYFHNHHAIVRFIGTTLFADGIWIGIEFVSRSLGKNDGSVNGHVYFQCKPNYGLFIRPNRLSLTKK